MDHNAPTQLIFGPRILPVSSPLPLFCLFPLHILPGAVFVLPPPPLCPFFSSSVVGLLLRLLPMVARSIRTISFLSLLLSLHL